MSNRPDSSSRRENPENFVQRDRDNSGKGPRSYRRSDDRILEEINDRLCDNPYIDPSDLEIGIKEGEVLLSGTVESREDKRLAEDIAESVSGVRNVENRLHIRLKGI